MPTSTLAGRRRPRPHLDHVLAVVAVVGGGRDGARLALLPGAVVDPPLCRGRVALGRR